MLEVNDVTLDYGQSRILGGVTIQARPGEIACLMGPNGVGKTSLIKAIAGRHPRSGGKVTLDGKPLANGRAHLVAQGGVGLVPQGREIFPLMTVHENLLTGFCCHPGEEPVVPEDIYALFPVLKKMTARRGGDLSGGQQQQLAIARALITRPKVLLLDEPTEGIQPNVIQHIGEVIKHLRGQGNMAILLVEQFFEFAWELGDHFTVLRRGEVISSTTKSQTTRETLLQGVSV